MGVDALTANTTGAGNIAIGVGAQRNTTTGAEVTGVGDGCLAANTTGALNNAFGAQTLAACTTGSSNTAIGGYAGNDITTGGSNTCIGALAGDSITTGSNNIMVGYQAEVSGTGGANQISIAIDVACDQDNQITIGKASNTIKNEFDTDNAWTQSSDVRKKKNIEDAVLGLDFVNDLRPVTYEWKPNNEFPKDFAEYNEKNQMTLDVRMHGLVAQEVKEALDKTAVERFAGWKEDDDGCQRISKEMFVYPLIKAVQELSAEIEELKNTKCKCNEE